MKRVIVATAFTLICTFVVSTSHARPWRWEANQKNTPGWQLMTPEERIEHRTKMRSFTEYSACTEYVAEHHAKMVERAKERGVPAPVMRTNPCDVMKARGVLK